ncbi:MAG: hypothetical protein WCK91_01250 [bacterium]
MKNFKDTEKTIINSYGQPSVSDFKSLSSKHIYEYTTKKTEKIITAVYMVTDYVDESEPIRSKLRSVGIDLLSDIYELSTAATIDKESHISRVLSRIHETISFLEIASSIGFISDMNTSILKRELAVLVGDMQDFRSKDHAKTFTLSDELFSVPQISQMQSTKEIFSYKGQIKDTRLDSSMSDRNGVFNADSSYAKRQLSPINQITKEDRVAKILSIVKDKVDTSGKYPELSIKDISYRIPECSEKTIQRELNSLVESGQIRKTGAKRWSRYQAN